MSTLKKYTIEGKEVGEVEIEKSMLEAKANSQMIKEYIVALRANARQWSANTKGRSEVKHTTKKPHKQKGTGNARQGSLVTSQYRGGGIVFGPKPKFDQHIKLNKKERRSAIRYLIAEKIKNNKAHIIEDLKMDEPKTGKVSKFLTTLNINKGRVLFLGEGSFEEVKTEDKISKVSIRNSQHDNFIKSLRNIPKMEFSLAKNISGYDVMVAHEIIMTESALNEITEWLS